MYIRIVVRKFIVILSLLFASHFVKSQKVYHLDKKKAPVLQFHEMTNMPEKSITNTLTTEYDTKRVPKTDEFKALPNPQKIDFKKKIVLEKDVAERVKRKVEWKAIFIKNNENIELPDFLFKDNSLRNIKYLDKSHGFISNSVAAICQDSLGVIWLGTQNEGLCKITGSRMNVLNIKNGLPSNTINDLYIDSKGKLWVCTNAGVIYIDNNFIYQSDDEILGTAGIKRISEDNSGNLWFATNNKGAVKYKDGSIEIFNKNSGLPGNDVNKVYQDINGNIWFGLNYKGLCVYKEKSFVIYTLSQNGDYNTVKNFYEYNGDLWMGPFQSPLMKYVDGEFYTYKLFSGREPTVYSFTENRFGLWLAAYGKGLINLKDGKYKVYSQKDGLVGKSSFYVFNDSKDNLWVGDLISGLSRFDENIFYSNNKSEEIPIKITEGIKEDRNGNIWYLPNGQNLVKEDANHYTVFDNSKYLPPYALHHAFDGEFMPNGDIFLSTYSMGVLKITDSKFEYTKFDSGNFVMESSSFKPDEIWFSTMQNGLKKFNYKSFYDITSYNGLSGNNVGCIKHDSKGRLWVAVGGKGIDIINDNTIANLNIKSGLLSNIVTFFYPENDRFWIGTDAGINIIEGDNMLILTKEKGLISNHIRSIIKDKQNNYWISTPDGLSKIKFLDNDLIQIKNYSTEYGLNVTDFNSSVLLLEDGRIRWGTNHNILTAEPDNENKSDYKIKMNLDSFVLSDTTLENINFYADQLLVKPDNDLIINYYAIDWGNENTIEYEYSIINDGATDTTWQSNGKNTEVSIKDLSTGDYVVLIRAFTKNKVSKIKTVNITFLPHWYESTIFILFISAFFIIVGPLIFLIYTYNNNVKRRRLEKIVSEKTNELVEENKIKDALVQEIHHRVKNNLQSITSLVEMQIFSSQDDVEKKALADIQLRISAMAIVHEMLYSSDDIGKVSAKKYLEELVNSINEMSNTDKLPIEFKMNVEDFNIGMSNCISFGLLTSEIISNSIKYAFEGIEKPSIELNFKLDDSEVIYTITDNGIGFDPDLVNEDESLGLRLIDIFAKQLDSKLEYKFDNGTKVKLIIPNKNLN